ncbi:hypothetical protein Dda_6720 [Drechslerella dactyloides]|uniref:N-acetyltransferase domain-containing protein n=1 Tax=Drechslerella dactyloides TaxID=74499 RepID=A0AAD6IYC3_DREDA|nr:hypothetical protein Dda_6720 [Drechslerella dactyloides]
MKPTMRPACPADLPAILAISAAALDTHTHALFCHPFRESHPAAFLRVFQRHARKKALTEPDGVNFNVVIEDPDSGQVVAWAFWRRMQGVALEEKLEKCRKELQSAEQTATSAPRAMTHESTSPQDDEWTSDDEESSPSASRCRVRLTNALTAADNLLYFSAPHWYLSLLMVHPEYKRAGHGTRLTLWGMKRAAADGLPCLLVASDQGERLYGRLGWRMVGRRKFPKLEDMPDDERRREEELLGKDVVEEQFAASAPSVMVWGDAEADFDVFERYKSAMEGVMD